MNSQAPPCVTVRCSLCSQYARHSQGLLHWPSLAVAVAELGSRWGWFATSALQICPTCATRLHLQRARLHCGLHGHDWEPWTELPAPGLDEVVCERSCARCGADEVVAADCLVWAAAATPARGC